MLPGRIDEPQRPVADRRSARAIRICRAREIEDQAPVLGCLVHGSCREVRDLAALADAIAVVAPSRVCMEGVALLFPGTVQQAAQSSFPASQATLLVARRQRQTRLEPEREIACLEKTPLQVDRRVETAFHDIA